MRVALIADLHGNDIAFEAVLADFADEPVDQIVCLGDVAATGPQPKETVARLRQLKCPVVMGNADADLLTMPVVIQPLANDEACRIAAIDAWCAAQLDDADLAFLRAFRPTVAIPLPGNGSLIACHGSPRSFNERLEATTTPETLTDMLAGVEATIIAAGHTHTPMIRRHRRRLLVNPGSVGLPHTTPAAGHVHATPRAEYAIVTASEGRLAVDLRAIPFDHRRLLAIARESGMPEADWWCADWE